MSRCVLVAAWVACVSVPSMGAAAAPIAEMRVLGSEIRFDALVEHAGAVLIVETSAGEILRLESATGLPSFELFDGDGNLRADGSYRWELRLVPPGLELRGSRSAARHREGAAAGEKRPGAGAVEMVQSGSFRIAGGSFVADVEVERPDALYGAGKVRASAPLQTINDDLLLKGDLTVREFNVRIRLDDIGPSGFPDNDWALITNDGSGSGPERFSIEDVSGAEVPFTITAGAPSHSIFVSSRGYVGLNTAFPVQPLHVRSSYAAVVRLDSGFPREHAWDIMGSEGGFQVSDATQGTTPFVIDAAAPNASLIIAAGGDVGLGTFAPTARLHTLSIGPGVADGKVLVENANVTTPAPRELLELRNSNGQAILIFKDSTEAERWANGTFSTSFIFDNQANPGVEFTFGNSGDFTAAGTITPGSSRTIKEAFAAVAPREILSRVLALPITTWSYKADPKVRHIGPMAEDFFAAFAVGADAKGISVTDSAGVALAAIQALHQELSAKDAQVAALQDRVSQELAAKEAQIGLLRERLAAI
jgi:hypothetical protein